MNSKRNELLQVATQLAAGLNANPAYDYKIEIVDWATDQAKDLIEKVDAEIPGVVEIGASTNSTPQVGDSMWDASIDMYKALKTILLQYELHESDYEMVKNALAKARGEK